MNDRVVTALIAIVVALLVALPVGSAPIQSQVGINVLDSATSTWQPVLRSAANSDDLAVTTQQAFTGRSFLYGYQGVSDNWDRIRASDLSADAVESNIGGKLHAASFLLGFNGTTWDRLRTTAAGSGIIRTGLFTESNLQVRSGSGADGANVTGTLAVSILAFDPAGSGNGTLIARASQDAISNTRVLAAGPVVFNGATWDRARSVAVADAASTGLPAAGLYAFNGATWDRARGTTTNGLDVDVTRTAGKSNAATNITTNTSTVVKASAGTLNRVVVNVAGTTSNVRLFNDASAPCDTTFVAQLDTTALTPNLALDHDFTTGICALTAGGAAADITVLYQ